MKNMGAITLGVLFGLLVSVVFMWINPYVTEYKSLKKDKQYTDTTYLYKQGGTCTFGPNGFNNPPLNYNLRSWDGGKNWYVVDYNFDTKEFKVLGDVDTIYPGLLKHLEGWDNLTDYVSKNGEIKLDDTVGLKVLEGAGFTIKK
jgi:hypothetical protein